MKKITLALLILMAGSSFVYSQTTDDELEAVKVELLKARIRQIRLQDELDRKQAIIEEMQKPPETIVQPVQIDTGIYK